MGIFRITIRNTISQTESGATVGVYRWIFPPNDRRKGERDVRSWPLAGTLGV